MLSEMWFSTTVIHFAEIKPNPQAVPGSKYSPYYLRIQTIPHTSFLSFSIFLPLLRLSFMVITTIHELVGRTGEGKIRSGQRDRIGECLYHHIIPW
jgi:hypothetical protein